MTWYHALIINCRWYELFCFNIRKPLLIFKLWAMEDWIIGALINIIGSIAINFGTNLLKLGHDQVLLCPSLLSYHCVFPSFNSDIIIYMFSLFYFLFNPVNFFFNNQLPWVFHMHLIIGTFVEGHNMLGILWSKTEGFMGVGG